MANRFRLEQIQEFYITPTITQDGMVPKWNNNTKRFDWVFSLLQLGIGHEDAYYGDLGKVAYDHSQSAHSYEPLITKTTGYAKIVGGVWTFDNSTFITSLSGAVLTNQSTPQTIGDTTNRLSKIWLTNLTMTNTIVGNIDTANKLYASKTINGVAFDGSQNITVPSDIAAGSNENVMLSNGTIWTSGAVPGRHLAVTLATDNGLSLSTQTLALGTPSSITSTSTNSVTTTTHTHAITASLALIGNGSAVNQIPLTGTTPFVPTWTTVTNLVSLNNLSFASTAFVKMTAANTFGLDTNVYVIKSGDTGLGNMYFANNSVIDVVSSIGSDVLNIGTTNADVINIGYASSTVNINGIVSYQYATDLKVVDKLITLNVNGGIASGVSSGFEVEENGVTTGWFTTSGARTGFELRAPATSYSAIFLFSGLGAERTYTWPNASGTVALTTNLHNAITLATDSGLALSTQVLNMGTPSNITPTTTNSVTTNTHTHAITAGLGWIGNGSQANEILVTGTTPFTPAWTLATNLVSLNALSFASTSFVKMSSAGTFGLDTNTYIISGTVPTTITVANEATDTTCFPLFATDATGNLAPKTNTGYLFNSATGMLTVPGTVNITGGDAVTHGVKNVQLPVSIAVGAGLSTRQTTGESIIQFGNNYQAHYTGAIDSTKAGVMIRLDTRNGTGGIAYGGQAYTLFQIQTRVAGTTTSEIPFQLTAAPTGSFIMNTLGNIGFGILPTANLHPKASTAAANTGAIKLTAGVLATVPEAGLIEFDGTYWYLNV